MIIDFSELSKDGREFENLVFDLLSAKGFRPELGGVGPDDGIDLTYTETVVTVSGATKPIHWVVQCKQRTSLGKSLRPDDVGSIADLLERHKRFNGYALFTTASPSDQLQSTLNAIAERPDRWAQCITHFQLEKDLLRDHQDLLQRYFPLSYARLFGPALAGPPTGLRSLVLTQREEVLNVPLLPWTPFVGPRLRFLIPDLLIDAAVTPSTAPRTILSLDEWDRSRDGGLRGIAILGTAGSGKSVALSRLYLKAAKRFLARPANTSFPLYLRATDPMFARASSISTVLRQFARRHRIALNTRALPSVELFIDGLDEVDPVRLLATLRRLFHDPLYDRCVTSVRTIYFQQAIAPELDLANNIHETIELQPWPYPTASQFARRYFGRLGRRELFPAFTTIFGHGGARAALITTPFRLQLALFLLSEGSAANSYFESEYNLYEAFYETWIARERRRGTSRFDIGKIRHGHEQVAVQLYQEKGRPVAVPRGATSRSTRPALAADSAFAALLEWSVIGDRAVITRFAHETLGEFHVANWLVSQLRRGGGPLRAALGVFYTYEVNVFVRGSFECASPAARRAIATALLSAYSAEVFGPRRARSAARDILSNRATKLPVRGKEYSLTREQVLYYAGRLSDKRMGQLLRFAVSHEVDPVLRRIAALGAILHGDTDAERVYVTSLVPGSDADVANRSFQLVYFGDVVGAPGEFVDEGSAEWTRVRHALLLRLQLDGPRERRLRWWDVRTLLCFFLSRRWLNAISADEIAALRRIRRAARREGVGALADDCDAVLKGVPTS